MAGRIARLSSIVIVVAATLGACTAQQIGQTIYNSMKAHCESNPDVCTALDDY